MKKRNNFGEIEFKNYPQFRPNLTPKEIFDLGSFGGTYWRPIFSSITKKKYKNKHLEYSEFSDIPENKLSMKIYNKNINKYKEFSGSSLKEWEDNNWITEYHPYGWVQWYCDFYNNYRCEDDLRQIKRWIKTAGPKSRFRKRLINMIKKENTRYDDYNVSPRIRQTLQHWAYELKEIDLKDN